MSRIESSRTSSASSATWADAAEAVTRRGPPAAPARLRRDADLPRPAGHPRPAAGRARRVRPARAARAPTSPPATATGRSRRRCSSRPRSSSAAIGEVTDVVEKELFRIAPRTEEAESWALRPEPTAGIVRAYVQHGMQTLPQPVKLTMTGPMFRYDRPAGRPLPPVLAVRRRGDRRPGPGDRRRDHRARHRASTREVGLERRRGPASTRSATPACRPAYIAELTAVLPRPRRRRCPRLERDRLERNAAAAARLEGPGDGGAERGRAADHGPAVRRVRGALRGRPGAPRRARRRRTALEPGLVRGLDYYTRTAFEFYVARPRGPAAGARRRRPLRRPRRAARRQADARDRVRARARPGRARARASRASRPRPEPGPLAVVVGADPDDTVDAAPDRDGPAGGRARVARRPRAGASSASSSRPPARTAPTSR